MLGPQRYLVNCLKGLVVECRKAGFRSPAWNLIFGAWSWLQGPGERHFFRASASASQPRRSFSDGMLDK
jgi:hypothetical protein